MNARSLGIALSLSSLAACTGAAAPPPADQSAFNRATTSVARGPFRLHADRRRSWFAAELAHKQSSLLFVSDSGTADVYVYSLPALKLMATVTGFSQPQGECSDNKGNVWIADTNAQTMYELSHHGRLVNEIKTTGAYPVSCAWDATTGDLAVMSLFNGSGTSGDVLVYASGSGSGVPYTNPSQYYYDFGGYDSEGNLFFDGLDTNGNFILSELPRNASSAETIKVSGGTIYYPGMVAWNTAKRELVVGDQSCGNSYASCLYTLGISGKAGTISREIALKNSSGGQICDLVQGALLNDEVAGSDFDFCGSSPSATYVWAFPGGGNPTNSNAKSDSVPVGAAVSK
jgi:hypothetical protein